MNNDNMVTAGRRRRKLGKKDQKLQEILQAHAERHSRSKRMINQSLWAAFIFMDLWKNQQTVDDDVWKALRKIGPWATMMGKPLARPFTEKNLYH